MTPLPTNMPGHINCGQCHKPVAANGDALMAHFESEHRDFLADPYAHAREIDRQLGRKAA